MDEKELKTYTKRLLNVMRMAEDSFDAGRLGEGYRLAKAVLRLLEDRPGAPAVLSALGIRDSIQYYDICPDYNPKVGLPFSGLAVVTIGSKQQRYVPRMDNFKFNKKVGFDAWWNKSVLVDEEKKINITRKKLAINVAELNIGNLDQKLNREFEELMPGAFEDSMPDLSIADIVTEIINIEFPSIRHLSFEIQKSLEESHPELFQSMH